MKHLDPRLENEKKHAEEALRVSEAETFRGRSILTNHIKKTEGENLYRWSQAYEKRG